MNYTILMKDNPEKQTGESTLFKKPVLTVPEKKKKKLLFHLVLGLTIALASLILIVVLCNIIPNTSVSKYIYHDVNDIPYNKYGLLLGTSQTVNGRENIFFTNRIKAAAALYHKGKITYIIASGATHEKSSYDGSGNMKRALIAQGIPADKILQDPYGYRTLDSVYRTIDVFALKNFTIISQHSHITRALYIARYLNLNAIAFAADDSKNSYASFHSRLREYFAKVKMILDLYILGMKPRIPKAIPPINSDKKAQTVKPAAETAN